MELTPAQIQFLKKCTDGFHHSEWTVELAGQAGSQRRFIRVGRENQSYILIEWDSRDEDWPRFLTIQKELSVSVPFLPHIYCSDPRHGLILEQDLGSLTLKQYCEMKRGDSNAVESIYRSAIDALFEWQQVDVSGSEVISSREMDLDIFMWETAYFARHCVTEYFGQEHCLTDDWNTERERMAQHAAGLEKTCMHRDFQSENILIHKGQIRFVDYQGARLGPPQYDLASLLQDPYVDALDPGTAQKLHEFYMSKWNEAPDEKDYYICSAQRLMQALGAYGNLSLHKGKPRYSEFVPVALRRLASVFEHLPEYPVMGRAVRCCLESMEENGAGKAPVSQTEPIRFR
ncbi:MAG: aminoglycoside phosphotransferase family protein [Chitinispirillaceae bacterium]